LPSRPRTLAFASRCNSSATNSVCPPLYKKNNNKKSIRECIQNMQQCHELAKYVLSCATNSVCPPLYTRECIQNMFCRICSVLCHELRVPPLIQKRRYAGRSSSIFTITRKHTNTLSLSRARARAHTHTHTHTRHHTHAHKHTLPLYHTHTHTHIHTHREALCRAVQ